MSMTRKDYELIAAAIKRHATKADKAVYHRFPGSQETRSALSDLADDLAGELAAANPAFKADKFLKACGVA
jgi:hypothetical protein